MTKDSSETKTGDAKDRRGPQGLVTVFAAWCKGCGICIEFCPQDVFEAGEQGEPLTVRAEACNACGWCEMHCPDMAIVVRRLDEEEAAELRQRNELARQGVLPAGGNPSDG